MGKPINIGMPDNLDIGPTYTIRVTALDPTTGNLVPNVTIDTVVLTVALVEGSLDELASGQWFLVPGPNA